MTTSWDDGVEKMHKWWEPGVEFAGHVLMASLIFVVVALAAVGLDVFMGKLDAIGTKWYYVATLKGVEIFLFMTDIVTFVIYVGGSAVKFVSTLWVSWKR